MNDRNLAKVNADIKARFDERRPITLAEYQTLRLNSYDREYLLPWFDNECLIHITKHTLHHCSHWSNATYDGYLNTQLVPELLKRLEEIS